MRSSLGLVALACVLGQVRGQYGTYGPSAPGGVVPVSNLTDPKTKFRDLCPLALGNTLAERQARASKSWDETQFMYEERMASFQDKCDAIGPECTWVTPRLNEETKLLGIHAPMSISHARQLMRCFRGPV